ncbi:MAG: hypothetical protein H6643_11420 [Caldilineaceae bacterium]|nr:hypothetical protein [Caldilineaceae bacterium]
MRAASALEAAGSPARRSTSLPTSRDRPGAGLPPASSPHAHRQQHRGCAAPRRWPQPSGSWPCCNASARRGAGARLCPADVFPHERFHPARVERLKKRLTQEGRLVNPPIVAELGDGRYVVLDGATRVTAFKQSTSRTHHYGWSISPIAATSR